MPIQGSQVFAELQNALAQLRNEVLSLDGSTRQIDQRIDQLVSQRSEHFVALARIYLPDLSREAVARSFAEVRGELQEILRRRNQRSDQLIESIDEVERQLENWQQETDRVTDELNEKARQRDELQEKVAEQLKQMPAYEKLTNQAARAEQRLTSNEERMQQLNEEAAEKLPSYDNSRLFRYLYDRRFGTVDYQYRGLTRRLDRWLANLIGYQSARSSYEFLNITPELMSAELQRRRDQFDALMDQIESTESEVEQQIGLSRVIKEGENLGRQRDTLIEKMEQHNRQLREFHVELTSIEESRGRFYDEAMTRMRKHLEETEAAVLEKRASQTADTADDRIVDDIAGLNHEIEELQPQSTLLNQQRSDLAAKQDGLDRIVMRFRSSNFDSQRSVFQNKLNPRQLIDRFLAGELTTAVFWRQLRESQQFVESWAQRNATDILSDPSSQVVLHTMLDLAADALKGAARRSVHRRNRSHSGGVSWPQTRSSSRRSRRSGRSSSRRSGGFTTGNGF